ncbi:MAG TPA: hypothetical protein VM933_01310 [Acidimicrobiales bacterium]|nr:hypothetical protein [Acidimicrobiales bacterium]
MSGRFDPTALLQVLNDHGVRYVLLGGLAAAIHGSPYVTTDVDVVPAADRDNLERLSAALAALDAHIRTNADPLPFDHDGASLARGGIWNLATRFGDLEVVLRPSGTSGYGDLARDAEELEILGVAVAVASLADVVRSKGAAGREKDRVQLPLLRRLLEDGGG